MKKQALFIIPAIMAASAATAGGFDGFYVGAGIGDSVTVGSSRFDGSTTLSTAGTPESRFSLSGRSAFKKETFAGQLFAGYGWNCDCWYLGGEIYVKGFGKHGGRSTYSTTLTDLEVPVTSITETISVHSKLRSAEWGIDFRPGWLIGECTMLYGRVGAAFNQIREELHRSTTVSIANLGATLSNSGNPHSRKKNHTALRLGLGLEHKFMECWSIRADWVYTSFRRHGNDNGFSNTRTGTGSFAGETLTTTANAHSRLHNHTTMLGLSYYW